MDSPCLFSSPFPSHIGFACQSSDVDFQQVMPTEWALLSEKAVWKRQQQFAMGRVAAHKAMEQLGIAPSPILRGPHDEPLWPSGLIGSISHSQEWAVAAVAQKCDSRGVGIDIEYIDKAVSWSLANHISNPEERPWLEEIASLRYLRFFLLFSAKETIFKAMYPQHYVFLEFQDATLRWIDESASYLTPTIQPYTDLVEIPCSTSSKPHLPIIRGKFQARLNKFVSQDYPIGYAFEVGAMAVENYVFTYLELVSPT